VTSPPGIGCLRGRGTFEVHAAGAPTMPTVGLDDVMEISATASTGAAAPLLIDTRPADAVPGPEGAFRPPRGAHSRGDRGSGTPNCSTMVPCRPRTIVRQRLADQGLNGEAIAAEAVVYSGSGVSSALFIALMEHAGLPVAKHYVGGWSQWAADRSRPVALG
jgi:thiosulfate/3-mercaptopyruvate sulfurtransferase